MKLWPAFDDNGDLPPGIYQATMSDVLQYFGAGSLQRQLVARRLEKVYNLAQSTGQLARLVVFGSFITAKPEPDDVDIFMLMEDTFEVSGVTGEAAAVFDHMAAQSAEGASVFWIKRRASIGGEEETLAYWQVKRGGGERGIVEVTRDDQEQ